jgi:predicted metal-dependent hydrolase
MSGFFSQLKKPAPPAAVDNGPFGAAGEFRDPDDPRILYRLSKRASRISLKVRTSEREVAVIVPSVRALKKAQAFARENQEWIDVQLESLPPPMPFRSGGEIMIRGLAYRLISPDGRGRPRIDHLKREVIVPSPDAQSLPGRARRLLIREAREELEAATHYYADKLGRRVSKVSVRDQSSRWGSCITRGGEGQISYSWRLISAPPFVLEYVCAHECAHMIEANHSANFWAVCARISDDVKPAKKWLNKNGALLHAVGAEF